MALLNLDKTWMDDAACAGHPNPDIWYPDDRDIHSPSTREAQIVCASCPVQAECYEYGLNEPFGGIYGGVLLSRGGPSRLRLPSVPAGVEPSWKRPVPQRPERVMLGPVAIPHQELPARTVAPRAAVDAGSRRGAMVGKGTSAVKRKKKVSKVRVPCPAPKIDATEALIARVEWAIMVSGM